MKKLILLSILLIVGCSTMRNMYHKNFKLDKSTAYGADPTNKELCDTNMAAYLELIDADCPGYTNLSQAQINAISTMCD